MTQTQAPAAYSDLVQVDGNTVGLLLHRVTGFRRLLDVLGRRGGQGNALLMSAIILVVCWEYKQTVPPTPVLTITLLGIVEPVV